MNRKIKSLMLWSFFWLSFVVLLSIFLSGINISAEGGITNLEAKKNFEEILWNNTKNFMMYIVFFPISIVLAFIEFMHIGVSFYIGIQIYEWGELFDLFFPHLLLELPNILFYSWLSFDLARHFMTTPKVKTLTAYFIDNRWYYLGSYTILVVAAFLEGGRL